MNALLVAAALACLAGDRLVDWSSRLPPGTFVGTFVVSLAPFYTRAWMYRPGHPEEVQRCCGNRPISTIRVPITDGRICVGQSQQAMTLNIRLAPRPDVAL